MLNRNATSTFDDRAVQRFEYRIETIEARPAESNEHSPAGSWDEQLTQALNRWGRQGWRVCHVTLGALAPDAGAGSLAQVVLERRLDNWLLNEEDD